MELLLEQFDLHHKLFNNVLDGFSDEETNQRPYGNFKMNHVKYLAGHILDSQYGLAAIAGVEVEPKWPTLFAAANQSSAKDDILYPHIQEILAEWNLLYSGIRQGLSDLTRENLRRKSPLPFFETVGNMWAFLNHHQAYHIGQISILRRAFGKEAMRYD